MRKEKLVTRTMTISHANVLVVNDTTNDVEERMVTVPGSYKVKDKLLKAINQTALQPGEKAVHASEVTEEAVKYGMTESVFLANAKKM